MFESYIRSLYENWLGEYLEDYFENVSDQNITFKVFSGKVSLNDLKIRKSIFQKLNMPFILKLGIIKTLEINMPFMNIQSAPVVANIDEVYIVVSPQNPDEWQMLDKVCFDFKLKKFEEYIKRFVEHALIKQAEKSLLDQDAKDKKQQDDKKGESQSYMSNFLKRIQDNVKIEIKNVHIRLEDQKEVDVHGQGPGVKAIEQMCIGLSLREIVLQTIEYKPDDKEESVVNGEDDESDIYSSNAGVEDMAFQYGSQICESPFVLSTNKSKGSADDVISKKRTKDLMASKIDKASTQKIQTSEIQQMGEQYYFDRTLPKNKDQPLQRILSIKDLAIYIESAKFQNNQPEKVDQVLNMISFKQPEFLYNVYRAPGNFRGRNRIDTIKEVPENVEGSAKQTKEEEGAKSDSSVDSSDTESNLSYNHNLEIKSKRSKAKKEKKEKKKKKKKNKIQAPEDEEGLDQVMRDLNEQMYYWFDQDDPNEISKAEGLSQNTQKQSDNPYITREYVGDKSQLTDRPKPKFKKPSFLMEPQSIQIKIIQQTVDLGDERQQRANFEWEMQKKKWELEKHIQAQKDNNEKNVEQAQTQQNVQPSQIQSSSHEFTNLEGDSSLQAKLQAQLDKKFVMKPQFSWIINMLTPLQVRISSAQFKCIYSLVSFIRQFQLAKSGYNLPQKYKYLRPVFADPLLSNKLIKATWWADFKQPEENQNLELQQRESVSSRKRGRKSTKDEFEMEFGDEEEQDQIKISNGDEDDFVLVEEKIDIVDEIAQNEQIEYPDIGQEDIQFTRIVNNLMKKSRNELVERVYVDPAPNYHVDRNKFKDKTYSTLDANDRKYLHLVKTESLAAKGLFQFAVLCVIKNNRMKRGEMLKDDGRNMQHQEQFQMNQEQKDAHQNALKLILEKTLSFSGQIEEPKDKKSKQNSESRKKETDSTSKKEKEVIKNFQQMMRDQQSQKANKENNTFEKLLWIQRARINFTEMEELVLRHSLEALSISDLKRQTRLIIHEFVLKIEQQFEKEQIEEQQKKEQPLLKVDDFQQQLNQINLDLSALGNNNNTSRNFLTPRQSTMMLTEENEKIDQKSGNSKQGGLRWMNFFKSMEPKSPKSASSRLSSRGSSKSKSRSKSGSRSGSGSKSKSSKNKKDKKKKKKDQKDEQDAPQIQESSEPVIQLDLTEPKTLEQNLTINTTQPQEIEEQINKSVLKRKDVQINIIESTPTQINSPSDNLGQSCDMIEEQIDIEGSARQISNTNQIKMKKQLSNESLRLSFVDIDSDDIMEAKKEADLDILKNKFNEFFEEAKGKTDRMQKEFKEKKEEFQKDVKEKKQQFQDKKQKFMDKMENEADEFKQKFKKMTEDDDKKKEEKEKKAQPPAPTIENMNNFSYLVNINLSMIKVQLVDINRQKNTQTANQQKGKDGNNPQISSLCLEVYKLGVIYHQFWESNIFTIQNKSLVVHEQKQDKQQSKTTDEDLIAHHKVHFDDENNFIQIRPGNERNIRQAWKLTLKSQETTGPSVDNYVENSTFFIEDSVQTEETPSPHLNIESPSANQNQSMTPIQQSQKEIEFHLGKVSVLYKSQVIKKLYQFFRLDEKASKVNMALNKLAEKTEQQEKQRYIEEQKEKIKNKIKVHYNYNIEQIEVKLPFKLQHAKMTMVPESEQDRQWLLNIQNIEVKPPLFEDELEFEHSVCDLYRLSIKEMCLTYFKGTNQKLAYPIIAPSGFDLLLKVKNSLKYLLAQQDANNLNTKKETSNTKTAKPSILNLPDKTETTQPLVEIPDIDICQQKNRNIRKLVLNFTPDSYNGLLNIYSVIQPNVDKTTAQAQFQEKMTIFQQCVFRKNLLCKLPIPSLENRPSSEQWQKFDVVLSGDYLYFYKDKFTLLPSYFMEVASIQIQSSQEGRLHRHSFQQPSGDDNLLYKSRIDPKTASARNLLGKRSSYLFQKSTEMKFYSCESSKMGTTIDNSPKIDIRNKKNGQVASIDFSSKGTDSLIEQIQLKKFSEENITVSNENSFTSPRVMPMTNKATQDISKPMVITQNTEKLIRIDNLDQTLDKKDLQKELGNIPKKAPGQIGQVSSKQINFLNNNQTPLKQAMVIDDSDNDDEEYDKEDGDYSSSSNFNQSSDENISHNSKQFNSFNRPMSYNEAPMNYDLKLKTIFLSKISDRQNEINMAHLNKESSTLQKEHQLISSQVTEWEDYNRQVSFQLSLQANEVDIRMHEEEEFVDVNQIDREYDAKDSWSNISSSKFDLFLKQGIYNMRCNVSLKEASIFENKVFKREMIYLPQTTLIESYVWARDSPTVDNSYSNTIVSLSKNSTSNQPLPIVLYDPEFVNKLTKFFKNTANQELTSLNFYIQKLFDQKKSDLKKEKQKAQQIKGFRKGTKVQNSKGLSDDDSNYSGIRSVDSALSSPSNSINQKYMTPQFKTSFRVGAGSGGGGAQTHRSNNSDKNNKNTINYLKMDLGNRELKTIQIGGPTAFDKEISEPDQQWSSSGSDLDDDNEENIESKSNDSLKKRQKMQEDHMNKQIAKHQNCKKVYQLMSMTKVVGLRGLHLICLHHSVPLAPYFEIKAETFELVYDMHLCHGILDVKIGIGQEGLSDLTCWPWTKKYQQQTEELAKSSLRCEQYIDKLNRQGIIQRMNPSKQSIFRIKTTMYYDTCPIYLEESEKPKQLTACEFFLNNVYFKYYQEMFLRVISYFTNRFLWAVTYADPYDAYEKKQLEKHAVKPKPLPEALEDIKDLDQVDFTLDFQMDITESVVLMPLRPQAEKKSYFQINVDKVTITSETEQQLGRFKPNPNVKMKMSKFIIDCMASQLVVMPLKKVISNKFDLQLTFASPIESEILKKLPLFRTSVDQRLEEQVLDMSSELVITIQQSDFNKQKDPEVEITFTREIFCLLMKLNNLNMACSDLNTDQFDFTWQPGIFDGETRHINTMSIILYLKGALSILLEDDNGNIFSKLSVSQIDNKQAQSNKKSNMNLKQYQNRQKHQEVQSVQSDWFMKCKMYTNNQMLLNLNMKPKLIRMHQQSAGIYQKYLILGDFDNTFDQNKMDQKQKMPKLKQHSKLSVAIKFLQTGVMLVQCRLKNSMIYADVETLMKVIHLFINGLPSYDFTDALRPLNLDLDKENSPGLKFEFKMSETCLGLLDLDADPKKFDKLQPILICNPQSVFFSLNTYCIKQIKVALYKVLKQYRDYSRKKLRNEKENNIKSMQIAPFNLSGQLEGTSSGYKQRQNVWTKDNLPLASIDESLEMVFNRNNQQYDSFGDKKQLSMEKKQSLQRLSEQDSQLEQENSAAINEEQEEEEEVIDVDSDIVSQMTFKLRGIGIQIIPLEKLEMLEFAMSRDLISPLNSDIVIQECLKVQFKNLESKSTFSMFDRMDVDVEPLSVHATVKDLEVVQTIIGSIIGSWNKYSEFNSKFIKQQQAQRMEKLKKRKLRNSLAYSQSKENQSFDQILRQDGLFSSQQQADIDNFLVPNISREASRENSQQFMSCNSQKVSINDFEHKQEQKQNQQMQEFESFPYENYESAKVDEISMIKRNHGNMEYNIDSMKNSLRPQSRRIDSHRRNLPQSLRLNDKAYLITSTGKDISSIQSSQDHLSINRDVKKAGVHQISQKLYFNNNVSQYSEQSRQSIKSRHSYKSRRSMLSRHSMSEDMNQFHDAQSRLIENKSNFDSGDEMSQSNSESSASAEDEMNEESFMSCHLPFSMNNSVSIEQPKRIGAARAQDYPPDKSPLQQSQNGELAIVKENTVDGNSSNDPSGQKKQESQTYLLTDLSIDEKEKTLATELQEAVADQEQDDGFRTNFDGIPTNIAVNEDAQQMIINSGETNFEKEEEKSESSISSEEDLINHTIIQWKTINKIDGDEDEQVVITAKRESITQVQLKSINLVLLLPPYIKKSSSGSIGNDVHLSKKLENEILQYFPMIMLNIENVYFKMQDFDNYKNLPLVSDNQASLSLNMEYYNGRLDCWEPFLEHLQIEVLKHQYEDGTSEQVIEAKNSINFNITEELIENVSCLQNLSRDIPLFINDRQAPTVFSATPTTQFKIRNLTSKALLIRPNAKNTNKLREKVLKYQNQIQFEQNIQEQPQVQYVEGDLAILRSNEGHALEPQRKQQIQQKQQILLQDKSSKKRHSMRNQLVKHPIVQKQGISENNKLMSPNIAQKLNRRSSNMEMQTNQLLTTGDEQIFGQAAQVAQAPQESNSQQQLLKINSGQSGIYHVRRSFQDNQGLLSKRQPDASVENSQMSDKIDIIIHKSKRELPKNEPIERLVIKEETTTISRYNLFRKTVFYQPMSNRTNDFIMFGLSEGLLSVNKNRNYNSFHNSLMRSIDFRLRNVKTFTIRNPFVLVNKTEYVYLVKIQIQGRMHNDLTYPSETWQLCPGQSYPISYSEYKHAKFYLAMNLDHPDNPLERMSSNYSIKSIQYRQTTQKLKSKEQAIKRIDQPDKSIQWSHGFTIRQFFEVKEDPKNKQKTPSKPSQKCFVQHQKRFSMIFAEPSTFFTSSDICIKSPVIIKNLLPLDILIRTRKVLDYDYKAFEINMPVHEDAHEHDLKSVDEQIKESQNKKEIIYSQEMETRVIEPGKSFSFHNFHLNKEIGFEVNVRIKKEQQQVDDQIQNQTNQNDDDALLLDWHYFEINKKQFKDPKPHIFSLRDRQNGQSLQLKIKVGRSLDTDVEMKVECDCMLKNLTEFPLRLFRQGQKSSIYKIIAGQDKDPQNSQWLSIFDQSKDCRIGILDKTKDEPKHLLPPFQQNKQPIQTVMLKVEDEKFFELILTQKVTLLQIKQIKIRYSHIIENRTGRSIIVSHLGWETRKGEILANGHNLPLYWPQSNPDRKLCFKFIENENQEQDLPVNDIQHQYQQDIPQIQAQSFVFTGGVPINQISSTPQTILCPNIECPQKSKTMELFSRQVNQSYFKHTNFIVLRCQEIEDPDGDGLDQHPQFLIQNRSKVVDLEYEQRSNRSDIKWIVKAGTNQILSFVDFKPSTQRKLPCFLVSRGSNQVYIEKSSKINVVFDANTSQQGKPTWSKEVLLSTAASKDGSRRYQSDATIQKTIRMEVVQDKVTKILRITEVDNEVTLIRSQSAQSEGNGAAIEETNNQEVESPSSSVKLRIPQIFLSLISHCLPKNMPRQEFILVCLNWLEYEQTTSNQVMTHQFKINSIQIDNNLCEENGKQEHPYPILLYSVHAMDQEWFNLVIEIQRENQNIGKSKEKKVVIVKRFEYLIQKMVLLIDDELIWCIQNMSQQVLRSLPPPQKNQFKSIHKVISEGDVKVFDLLKQNEQKLERYWERYERSMNLPVLKKHAFNLSQLENRALVYPSQENYDDLMKHQILIQYLSISPIQLTLTFTPRLTSNQKEIQQQQGLQPVNRKNPWITLLANLGLSLTAIEEAPLNLNALQQTDLVINTRGELTLMIQNHYLRKAYLSNAFKAILSSNTLGNVNMLVNDVQTGVKDFFYEPYQGYIQGPAQGTKGLIKGSASLVGNTAKGTIGTMGRIIGSVSQGMLVLADDKEYINQRQGFVARDGAPANTYQGLKVGLRSAFSGVKSGITGIYREPIKGAREQGAVKGFLKGSVKGLGGAIIKPTSGVLDLIAKTSQGTENMIGRKKTQMQMAPNEDTSSQQQDNPYFSEISKYQASSTRKLRELRPLFSSCGQLRQFSSLDNQAFSALIEYQQVSSNQKSIKSSSSESQSSNQPRIYTQGQTREEEMYEGVCLLNDNIAFVMSSTRLLGFEFKDNCFQPEPKHEALLSEIFTIEITESSSEFPILKVKTIHKREKKLGDLSQQPVARDSIVSYSVKQEVVARNREEPPSKAENEPKGPKSPRSAFKEEMQNIQINEKISIRIQDKTEGQIVCRILQDWQQQMMNSR